MILAPTNYLAVGSGLISCNFCMLSMSPLYRGLYRYITVEQQFNEGTEEQKVRCLVEFHTSSSKVRELKREAQFFIREIVHKDISCPWIQNLTALHQSTNPRAYRKKTPQMPIISGLWEMLAVSSACRAAIRKVDQGIYNHFLPHLFSSILPVVQSKFGMHTKLQTPFPFK